MLHRLVFLRLNLANSLQKHFEYDQIKIKIFGWGHKAIKKSKGKNHKLPSSRRSLKLKDTFSCETYTQRFPLFSTDSRLSTRMLIFRKQTRKQKTSFLSSPR